MHVAAPPLSNPSLQVPPAPPSAGTVKQGGGLGGGPSPSSLFPPSVAFP